MPNCDTDIVTLFKCLADILNNAVWFAVRLKRETFASMQIAMLLILII